MAADRPPGSVTTRPRGAATTGIGDLPYRDVDLALDRIFATHPEIPYWPRLPKRDRREGMIGQFLGRFPYLQLRRPTPTLSVEGDSPELIQAIETIKLILEIGETLTGRLLIFDALAMEFRELKLRRDTECPVCGEAPTITELIDYEEFCGFAGGDGNPLHVEVGASV